MNPAAVDQFIASIRGAFEEGDARAAEKPEEARNVASVQRQYQALARGDLEAFLETIADDIDMEIVGPPGAPMVGRWRGRDQVVEAVCQNFGQVEDQRPEIRTVVAQGDTVMIMARERGRFRHTKREYETHWVQVLTFRDGRVVRFRECFDSGPILEASRPT